VPPRKGLAKNPQGWLRQCLGVDCFLGIDGLLVYFPIDARNQTFPSPCSIFCYFSGKGRIPSDEIGLPMFNWLLFKELGHKLRADIYVVCKIGY
jgi:hypothetical protein